MDNRKKRLLGMGFVVAVLFAASMLAFQMQKAAPAAAPAQPAGQKLPIIMYHNISPNAGRQGKYTVSVKEFEGDLKYIKERGFTPILTQQLIDYAKQGKSLPKKPLMITFDDGFESFYAYAFPLLQKYDMCAVMAVVGQYADTFTKKEDHHLNYSYLTWPMIGELSKSGLVEIQSHTNNMHTITSKRRGCTINKGENKESYKALLRKDLELNQKNTRKRRERLLPRLPIPMVRIVNPPKKCSRRWGFKRRLPVRRR